MFRVLERSRRLGQEAYLVVQSVADSVVGKVSSVWSRTKEIFNRTFPRVGVKIHSAVSAFNQAISDIYARAFPGQAHLVAGEDRHPVGENRVSWTENQDDVEIRALLLSVVPNKVERDLTEDELTKAIESYKQCVVQVREKKCDATKMEAMIGMVAKRVVVNLIRDRRNLP